MASQLLGVSLRASRDTTQVMLGVSLRARLDTTLVTTSKEPVCPRVELILKIIIILQIIFLGFIKSKPC